MTRFNAYLRRVSLAVREHSVTGQRALVFTIVTSFAMGCGGGPRGDTYARATESQQSCCEHLAGPSRDGCLKSIVHVDDPKVRDHDVNQATYRCVVNNFTCDETSGHATPASAQTQLECIQDLTD